MKLQTSFSIAAGVLGAAGIASLVALILTTSYLHRAAARINEAVQGVYSAEEYGKVLLGHYRRLQNLSDRYEKPPDRLDYWAEQLSHHIQSTEEEELTQKVMADAAQYFDAVARMKLAGGPSPEALRKINEARDAASTSIEQLVKMNLDQAGDMERAVAHEDEMSRWLGFAAIGLAVLLIPALVLATRAYVVLPLVRLQKDIAGFGDGKYEGPRTEPRMEELCAISRSFQALTERLQRLNESRLRFVAAVAHDLRNPIHAIRLSTDLLASPPSSGLPTREQGEYLAVIRRQAAHLERMLEDLLDTARIQAGKLELRMAKEDLRHLARESTALFQAASSIHRISLTVPDDPVPCRCDPVRIEQVVNNFISNAIKYSPGGGDVQVTVSRANGQASISVSDQGLGISEQDRSTIFEPFRRGDAVRETIPGVGLGLSASLRIATAHGGHIDVQSAPGRGSVFSLVLKAEDPAAAEAVPAAHPAS